MSPKAGLDKDRVVQAAVELLSAEGLAGLTLGRLAERLGVQTPSLYNHVEGLPGLQRELALRNARSLGDRFVHAAIARSGTDALRAIAQAYRAYIMECPALYMFTLRASGNQPSVDPGLQQEEQRMVQVGLAVMASLGLEGDDAVHALRGFRSLVHGFATLEAAGGFGMPLDCDESFRRLIDVFIRGLRA